MSARVLVVDDYAAVAALIGASLRSAGYEAEEAVAYAEGVRAIESKPWDVIVSDLSLDAGHTGLEVLQAAKRAGGVPFILMSGLADVDSASQAVKNGAVDCLAKPVDMKRLTGAVARAVERRRAPATEPSCERLVGRTQAMIDVFQSLGRAAQLEVPLLIAGPEGSGKLLAAREVHRLSARASAEFRVVECAGTTQRALEEETEAAAREGGTVVMRRAGEMSRELQARLAELLEEHAGARFVVTTRGSVGDLAVELLYVLGPGAIRMPALRDHADDIQLMAKAMDLRLTCAAEALARSHPWPGNVRELCEVLAEAARAGAGPVDAPELEAALKARRGGTTTRLGKPAVSFCASCGRTVEEGEAADGGECEHAVVDLAHRFIGNRYLPYRLLARGEASEIWVAWQPSVSRRVVVKVVRATTREERERFRREARIHASLRHPRVPALIEAGEDPQNANRVYMAMEFVEGEPLQTHVRLVRDTQGEDAARRAAVRLCAEAAGVLGYLHDRGLVHRDVKPPNLIVDGDGVHLIDYGLARAADDECTTVGVVQGTVPYMSPEQTLGRPGAVDARSDVWSLGATLYTLLTGRHPFGAGDYEDVADRIRRAAPVPIHELNPGVRPELEAVVARAMSKDPASRYANGRELEAALAAAEVATC